MSTMHCGPRNLTALPATTKQSVFARDIVFAGEDDRKINGQIALRSHGYKFLRSPALLCNHNSAIVIANNRRQSTQKRCENHNLMMVDPVNICNHMEFDKFPLSRKND